MEHTANQITLCGSLHQLPQFSHENHGRRFYRFYMEVPRLSGTVDILPVIAGERLLHEVELSGGDMVAVRGQIRSHNSRENGIRHLLIFVYAESILVTEGEAVNDVILEGPVCREPTYRTTPLGREICDMMLAVPRSFHRADYLPCIAWGRTAQELSQCAVGNTVQICGRLQSRTYTKQLPSGPEQRTAYEISALTARITDTGI